MDHLDGPVEPPKEIRLEDGQYELGRLEDAQLTIALPTVSGKHALLRVGAALLFLSFTPDPQPAAKEPKWGTPFQSQLAGIWDDLC